MGGTQRGRDETCFEDFYKSVILSGTSVSRVESKGTHLSGTAMTCEILFTRP